MKQNLTGWLENCLRLPPKLIGWLKYKQCQIWNKWSDSCLVKTVVNWLDRINPNKEEYVVGTSIILLIPNLLSWARLLIVPLFILGAILRIGGWFYISIYLILMSLDAIDGPIARQADLASNLGKALDPIVDKVSHTAMLLVATFIFRAVPIWFLAIVIVKELILVCWSWRQKSKLKNPRGSCWYGKLGTLIETIVLIAALCWSLPSWIFVAVTATQVFSLLMYLRPQKSLE